MPGTIVVVVVLSAGELHCPPADAAIVAMRGTLLAGDQVLVREVQKPLDDDKLVALRTSTGSTAVVEIAWSHPDHASVHLHVGTGGNDFADRDLTFTTSDQESERGRTVGLVLSSMLEGAVAASRPGPPAPRGPRLVYGLDLAIEAAHGFDVDEGAFGARMGAVLRFDEGWLRASTGFRLGTSSRADAEVLSVRLAAGAAGVILDRSRWRVALGADVAIGHQWVERHRADGDIARSRWTFEMAPFVHASFALGPRLFLFGETGPVLTLPRTRVRVGDEDRGTLSVLGWSGGAGARFWF
ncbi:MAG: hypothetical protein JNL79_27095 [Myxococcales bacterium]|nr:hypothetical protein [Myxococcales bacterium]